MWTRWKSTAELERRIQALEDRMATMDDPGDLCHGIRGPLTALHQGNADHTIMLCGKLLESALQRVCAAEGVGGGVESMTIEKLLNRARQHISKRRIKDYIGDLQKARNRAAHAGGEVTEEDAVECVRKLVEVLAWYLATYEKPEPSFEVRKSRLSAILKASLALLLLFLLPIAVVELMAPQKKTPPGDEGSVNAVSSMATGTTFLTTESRTVEPTAFEPAEGAARAPGSSEEAVEGEENQRAAPVGSDQRPQDPVEALPVLTVDLDLGTIGADGPTPFAVDPSGQIHIADAARHHILVFSGEGPPDRWPRLTKLTSHEPHRLAAQPPTGEPVRPVAVTTIPRVLGADVAVLDHAGGIRIMNANGRPRWGWSLPSDAGSDPVAPHISWTRGDRIQVFWGDGVLEYTRKGSQIRREVISLGEPSSVATHPGGGFFMAHGHRVAFVHPDMRVEHMGVPFSEANPPADLSLAADDQGRLWALSARGEGVRFGTDKLVDVRFKLPRPLPDPRFLVSGDHLHIAGGGRILRLGTRGL